MTGHECVAIVHGVPERMRDRAVELYDEAFGAKFAVAAPDRTERLQMLSASLNLEFAFAAVSNNRLVGIAGYKTDCGAFTGGMNLTVLTNSLGKIRGVWAACVFSLYERTLKSGELLMDGIVVEANARGNGIGTMLLGAIVDHAKKAGYGSVRLDVIDTNPDAQRLYERNSFVVTSIESYEYLRWLIGFGGSTTLTRDI